MILSEISIKRPIAALVLSALLIIAGVVAFTRLQVRELPEVTTPSVTVRTTYSGASPEIMETRVTKVIEDELSGISGIKKIVSNSRSGSSWISVEFNQGRDMLEAISDVRDAVARARKSLPDDCDEPIASSDNGEDEVVMWLNLSSSSMERVELSDYADRFVVGSISLVDGVSQVKIVGGLEKVMYVRLIPVRMAALGITVNDIIDAIGYENVELPSGEIRNSDMIFPVRIKRVYVDAASFEMLPIRRAGMAETVRLRDVAEVELKAKNEESIYHRNGLSSIGIGIIPQSNANPLEVAAKVRAKVEELSKFIPRGASLEVDYDSTVFISNSIFEVYNTLVITALLVVVVLYLFIGSWRTTLIPAVTVPISLIAAFAGAWFFAFSINIITLLSLILAIGLVVDDAIVMVENISYHLRRGEGLLAAAWNGAREVGFAIVATSLVLIMIFLPLMFMDGSTGRLFVEFAALMALAVFFSSVVALTLSPALSVLLLKSTPQKPGLMMRLGDWCLQLAEKIYASILAVVLANKFLLPAVGILMLGGIWLFYAGLPHNFVPAEDRGVVYVYAAGEEGASIHRMKRSMQELEQRLLPTLGQGVVQSISFSTPSLGQGSDQSGFVVLQLVPWEERRVKSADLVYELKQKLADIPDMQVYVYEPGFKGKTGSPVKYVLRGTDFNTLYAKSTALVKAAEKAGVLVNASTNYSERTPEIEVSLNPERASAVGVSLIDASKALHTALGGIKHTTFVDRGEEYDVYLRADEQEFKDLNSISSLNIRTDNGDMVSLGSIADFKLKARAKRLPHFDRQKSITISAYPAPGQSLGDALDWLDAWSSKNLEADMSVALTGESLDFRESEHGMMNVLLLAVLVAYLVLAAQFESFIHPLIVMTTIPLGILGGLWGLWMMGLGLNIYSQIGLLLLMGMVTKNGILIVEFANQLRDRGYDLYSATLKAAVRRLRPIVMTSLTAIIGAFPLVVSGGPGYESRQAVGAVIFYGMGVSTVITLLILPALYFIFARFTSSHEQYERRLRQEVAAGRRAQKKELHLN